MPLVRKPTGPSPPAAKPEATGSLQGLASSSAEERWAAARAAADVVGGATALAAALRTESDPRVREAMFTSLARIGTPECVDEVVALLRSDNAHLRTGALDALRIMTGGVSEHLPGLLSDPDVDVRILSCELARNLPAKNATSLLCALLAREQEANVCAAAIDVLAEVGTPEALPTLAECAQRFRDSPFLGFAIKIAADRIQSQPPDTRG
jgi:HEAT repeat protein